MGKRGQKNKTKTNITKESDKEISKICDAIITLTTTELNNVKSFNGLMENHKKIDDIIMKIKHVCTPADKEESDNDKHRNQSDLNDFLSFMKSNGAQFENIELFKYDGDSDEVGVKTLVPVKANQKLITVPRRLMIASDKVHESKILYDFFMKDGLLQMMPNVLLAMYLLVEKHSENSFWTPYIRVLPKKYNTILYYTEEELAELKGSPLLEVIFKQYKNVARQFAYFKKIFLTSNMPIAQLLRNKFTYDEYRWAVSTVMTRQNSIPAENEDGSVMALIPLWDMCNHTNGIITTEYNPESKQSECSALRDFQAGEEIFIFYGNRTNAEMLLHNGFVYMDNENDFYALRLGVSKSDHLGGKRKLVLDRLDLPLQSDFFLQYKAKELKLSLISFIKVFVMTEEELDAATTMDLNDLLTILEAPISDDSTRRAFMFLETRIRLLLAAYPTKLEEDEEILKNLPVTVSFCKKSAIQMRYLEKKILTYNLDYVHKKLNEQKV